MQDFYEPKPGESAPDFRLPSTEGKPIGLRDFKGKHVILYFYPKDDTPGCTKEACSFRDQHRELLQEGAVVLGVSTDPLVSHENFQKKYDLKFPLLSDESSDVAKMYGAWGERNLYGRRTWGVRRMTYWIGPDGRVRKVYRKVRAETHGEDVLADLRAEKSEVAS